VVGSGGEVTPLLKNTLLPPINLDAEGVNNGRK
jgi:hypothetical protein